MKAPSWYPAWRKEAFDQLMAKQDALATFKLGSWPRFDYDLARGTMMFSQGQTPKVRGTIQIAGTIGRENWMWSWSNAALPESSFQELLKVRAFGKENGIEELTSDYVDDGDLENLAWSLTAVSARILRSPAAYRGNTGKLPIPFFLFRTIGFVD
jgi:hypothetical protein